MEQFLQQTVLFRDCSLEEITALQTFLKCKQQRFRKGETILQMGAFVTSVGILLNGSASVEHHDPWGNQNIFAVLQAGELFAEMYALVPTEPLMVTIIAKQDCEVAFFEIASLFAETSKLTTAQQQVSQNLLMIAAKKNLALSQKIFHTSAKSIRQRVLSYLSNQALKHEADEFEIPYNRQQLAAYLNVDRSALSHELSKMQQAGLIRVQRNHFWLHTIALEAHHN
ncbi:MAG: Crp/Fnr family transcriptional regulator [Culicoidibacterales bacterium]